MKSSLCLTTLLVMLLLASFAIADVPQVINYQGFVADAEWKPLDTTVSMVFTIYDAYLGGSDMWTETQDVTIANGGFSVMLGSDNPIPDTAVDPGMGNADRYLEVQIGMDAPISPRTRLGSVPYAGFAQGISGHIKTEPGILHIPVGGDLYDDTSGTYRVTIEADSSGSNIHMRGGWHDFPTENPQSSIELSADSNEVGIHFEWMHEADTSGVDITADSMGSEITLGTAAAIWPSIRISADGNGGEIMVVNSGIVDRSIYNAHGLSFIDDSKGIVAGLSPQGLSLTAGAVNGYVLTTDGSGFGTWQPGGEGSSCWQCPDNFTYLTDINDSVGIGIETPSEKLEVDGNIKASGKGVFGYGHDYSGLYAFVAGLSNSATGDYATVSGGVDNEASGHQSVVSGGNQNGAVGNWSVVGGGQYDSAKADYSTVSGGQFNTASGGSSTVAGGSGNEASGGSSAIGGGDQNSCAGEFSAIPGGKSNEINATADYSMAFGNSVCVNSEYRVVFFDSSFSGRLGINRDCMSGIDYPIHVGTDATNGNTAYLTAGGTWTHGSSRSFKENFQTVDGDALLSKIDDMAVESWQYKGSDERHIGPVSEDFVAAFDVGAISADGERENSHLSSLDVSGVALVAIQTLHRQNQSQAEEIEQLRAMVFEMKAVIDGLSDDNE